MAYQASRNGGDGTRGSNYYNPSQSASMRDSGNGNDNQMSQDERNAKNNANNIRNAADVAIASKNPYAMAAGAVVKGADKITGGKSTEALGKAMNKANKVAPGGKKIQDASNKLSESGASDKIGQGARMMSAKNGGGAAGGATGGASGASTGANGAAGGAGATNMGKAGAAGGKPNPGSEIASNNGEMKIHGSMPASYTGAQSAPDFSNSRKDNGKDGNSSKPSDDKEKDTPLSQDDGTMSGGKVTAFIRKNAILVVILLFPIVFSFLAAIIVVGGGNIVSGEYDDALAANQAAGGDTGNVDYVVTDDEREDFMDRVVEVAGNDVSSGDLNKTLKIVAVYHIIYQKDSKYTYEYYSKNRLRKIANAFVESEEDSKYNLAYKVFPDYFPDNTDGENEKMADDVYEYMRKYYSFIGKNKLDEECVEGSGKCSYDIKGFYIPGRGNVSKNLSINEISVRLMQCGGSYGGTDGKPLEGADLVPFEKYILGVAYQEIGDDAPEQAFKAQLVAARSYILARPTDMGGWHSLKQEGDGWVLQVAACTQDQVYCDPDMGCSSNIDGQNGMVYPGLDHPNKVRDPMPEDSKLRKWASEVEGEVLVNSSGNVYYSDYKSSETNRMISLANSGNDYKQILLSMYGGSSDIKKNNCGSDANTCNMLNGDYMQWMQSDPKWSSTPMGSSGETLGEIGCLVTSIAMQIARSNVDTSIVGDDFNPGTFVEALNKHNGFTSGGALYWNTVTTVVPSFKYLGQESVSGYTKEQKLSKLKELVDKGYYVVAEVKGNTGQHWVAVVSVSGDTITMMDPASSSTDMWKQYNWQNTSTYAYYQKV